jgi:hypothetical protein
MAWVLAWAPTAKTMYEDLTIVPVGSMMEDTFEGGRVVFNHTSFLPEYFNCVDWTRQTALHWEIPLISVALYFLMIPSFKWVVATYGKWDVRNLAMCWNAFLSIFSWCGVFACVPVLVQNFRENGLYFTTCAPAQWYGTGLCGFFVALFVYSKVAELFDTFLLVVGKKPVIALQWWHHSTVLLYCWHSYSVRIATGLWFAAMNYSVHSVMYGYFALTATRFRKYVTKFAIFITLGQLLQMVVGMFVTVKAVLYQSAGHECHVNKTNSMLGLAMYFSYFVLFFILFVNNYCGKRKKNRDLPQKRRLSEPQLIRKASFSMVQDVSLAQSEGKEVEPEQKKKQ